MEKSPQIVWNRVWYWALLKCPAVFTIIASCTFFQHHSSPNCNNSALKRMKINSYFHVNDFWQAVILCENTNTHERKKMLAYKKSWACLPRQNSILPQKVSSFDFTKFKGIIYESYPFDFFQKRHMKALPFLKKPILLQNKVHYMTLIIKPTTGYTSPLSSSFLGLFIF